MLGGPKTRRRIRAPAAAAALLLALPLLALSLTSWGRAPRAPESEPPEVLFGDLFVAVQTAAIFDDGKAFADATPNAAPDRILADYHAAHPESAQVLKEFVDAHFTLPAQALAPPSEPMQVPIETRIDRLWNALT